MSRDTFPSDDWRSHRHVHDVPGEGIVPDRIAVPLHGTGGDEHSLVGLTRTLLPRAVILSPRGNILEGGRWPRFFRRFAEGHLDYEDAVRRTDSLQSWLESALEHYGYPQSFPLTLLGYSNGANTAGIWLLRCRIAVESAVLWRPALDLPRGFSRKPAHPGTRVLFRVGEQDTICPPNQAEILAQECRDSQHTVVWQSVPGVGHDLVPADFDAAAKFFA